MREREHDLGVIWVAAALQASAWVWLAQDSYHQPLALPVACGLAFLAVLVTWSAVARSRAPGAALSLACGVLVVGGSAFVISRDVLFSGPSTPALLQLVGRILRTVGVDATPEGGMLRLLVREDGFDVAVDAGVLRLEWLVSVFFFMGATALSVGRRIRFIPGVVAACVFLLGAVVLPFAASVIDFTQSRDVLADRGHPAVLALYDYRGVTLGGVLAAAVVALVVGWSAESRRQDSQRTVAGRGRHLATAACLGLLIAMVQRWEPLGHEKRGRVLIDDRLSEKWEPAAQLLTEDRFGDFSTYSFASMAEHLSHDFAVTVNRTCRYSDELLTEVDVLLLKTPRHRMERQEIDAIERWVARGGGLFVISDHTDLSGMSSSLNEVVESFGLRFRFDSTSPANTKGFSVYRAGIAPEHSIVAGIDDFELMTACTVDTWAPARSIMTIDGIVSERGDYSMPSGFGGIAPDASIGQGRNSVAAISHYGLGRVVAFGDSTVFSSFAYPFRGHDRFVLNACAWLNRSDAWPRAWFVAVVGALTVIGVMALWVGGHLAQTRIQVTICAGFLLGFAALPRLAAGRLALPASGQRVLVGFSIEGNHAALPAVLGSQPELHRGSNYATFALSPLRLGYGVTVVPRDGDALDRLDALVIINPDTESGSSRPSENWTREVREWVVGGGRLLVLSRTAASGKPWDASGEYVAADATMAVVSGVPHVSIRKGFLGSGIIVHVRGSEEFDVEAMGHCMATPDAEERRRYETAYALWREHLELPTLDRRTYMPFLDSCGAAGGTP